MRALLIGGTGNISLDVSKLLLELGHELVLLNRGGKNNALLEGATFIKGDIHNEEEIKKLIENESFDVVANFIAFTEEDVARDYRLFSGKTKQYIFISSASAYQKPPASFPITESTPLKNPYWQYSRDKIACEEFLIKMNRENGFPATIVRPSHTYSEHKLPIIGNQTTLRRMLAGKTIVIHGDGTSLWTLTDTRDFAKGFVGLMGNIHAIGDCIHITSDIALTWNQIYEAVASAAGVTLKAIHVSSDVLAATSKDNYLLGELIGDKANNGVFDNSKLKKLVPGFAATHRFEESVKRVVDNFIQNPENYPEREGFDLWCDRVVLAHEEMIKKINS